MSNELFDIWLLDQTLALSAALLSGTDLEAVTENDHDEILDKLEMCTQYISEHMDEYCLRTISLSTLWLLGRVPNAYVEPDFSIFDCAAPMGAIISRANEETERRNSGGISPRLLAHAVYLLKQKHITSTSFFIWLKRCCGKSLTGFETISKSLLDPGTVSVLESSLETARDPSNPTRSRLDAVDTFYKHVLQFDDKLAVGHWWANLCLAFRNSIFRWPLMISESLQTYSQSEADEKERAMCGISLPVGLSLSEDGKGRVWIRHYAPIGSKAKSRQYVPRDGEELAHISESKLCWDKDWETALQVGFKTAKALWTSQNGRLRFADAEKSSALLDSSLVVDVSAACQVVDTLFSALEGTSFPLAGRSAEVYWVQAALSLMLPGAPDPHGVATGRVEVAGGSYEIAPVRGIRKKLIYANNMGFSRVILPRATDDQLLESPSEAVPVDATAGDHLSPKDEVTQFIEELENEKSTEINFCPNVRSAADAMQTSGWRRTNFLRLPETQRTFHLNLHRLYLRHVVQISKTATQKEKRDYERAPWNEQDTSYMKVLDSRLLSESRAIKFVKRSSFRNDPEVDLGKWLAWKDQEIRSGEAHGYRGPGLGILGVRTQTEDNDMRLWSAIADTISADGQWWDKFQWSDRRQAASLLADLLSNQRCDLSISWSPAPDLLVILDDGGQTQSRHNRVFRDDFRGNWIDLLNPTIEDWNAENPLNEKLLAKGPGPLGNTKIIVIYGDGAASDRFYPSNFQLDNGQIALLEKLSVFRFGFTKQAAFSMANFQLGTADGLEWIAFNELLSSLIRLDLIRRSRDRFYITERSRKHLKDCPNQTNPNAHFHAAKALNPILDPSTQFVASNHDRELDSEPILEATWHLGRAAELSTTRGSHLRTRINEARGRLVFLSPYPDWDTVKQLRKHTQTAHDAVLLADELLTKEAETSNSPPHSSRVAAYFATIGIFANGRTSHLPDGLAGEYADKLYSLLTQTVSELTTSSNIDRRRQSRKLFSDYIFAMRNLGIGLDDERLIGPTTYLDKTIKEIVRSDIFSSPLLPEDFPISKEFWSRTWSDQALPLSMRSTIAYCASITSMDGPDEEPSYFGSRWLKPWMAYYSLTNSRDFSARQLVTPLRAWQKQFGHISASADAFGKEVMDLASFKRRRGRNSVHISNWGETIQNATENLWSFIDCFDSANRLYGAPADTALDIIRVTSLSETIPAYDFIRHRGNDWLKNLPEKASAPFSSSWAEFSRAITTSEAGWVSLLSSLHNPDNESLRVVRCWLDTFSVDRDIVLARLDPEFLTRDTGLEISRQYRRNRTIALFSGYKIIYRLACAKGNDSMEGRLRKILYDIDNGSDLWFFALANNKPKQADAGPIAMMINDLGDRDTFNKMLCQPNLKHIAQRVKDNLSVWKQLITTGSQREMFKFLEVS